MKKQEKKLRIEEIQVLSFITTLDWDEKKEIKGGSVTGQEGTELIVFCRG